MEVRRCMSTASYKRLHSIPPICIFSLHGSFLRSFARPRMRYAIFNTTCVTHAMLMILHRCLPMDAAFLSTSCSVLLELESRSSWECNFYMSLPDIMKIQGNLSRASYKQGQEYGNDLKIPVRSWKVCVAAWARRYLPRVQG